jgi:AraC-like DNA-binding protein
MNAADAPQLVPFITLPNWVKAATVCGVNIQAVFEEFGVRVEGVPLEHATIERTVMARVMGACVRRAQRHHFPFVLGETYAFEYLPDLETFVTTSPNLREAAVVFEWVRALINPYIDVHLREQGDEARLVLQFLGGDTETPTQPWFAETMFTAIHKFARQLIGGEQTFRALRLRHPAPAYAALYAEQFGTEIRFDQREDALVFDRALLDLPLPGSFPSLHAQARQRIDQQMRRLLPRDGLVATLELTLERKPALFAHGAEAMAEELGLHLRTLQRRLHEQQVHYQEIQDRVRYRLARRALRDPHVPLDTLSEQLGFSDRRSFTRAFRRWAGETPSAFRRRPATD